MSLKLAKGTKVSCPWVLVSYHLLHTTQVRLNTPGIPLGLKLPQATSTLTYFLSIIFFCPVLQHHMYSAGLYSVPHRLKRSPSPAFATFKVPELNISRMNWSIATLNNVLKKSHLSTVWQSFALSSGGRSWIIHVFPSGLTTVFYALLIPISFINLLKPRLNSSDADTSFSLLPVNDKLESFRVCQICWCVRVMLDTGVLLQHGHLLRVISS